jgi:hypothetical protein
MALRAVAVPGSSACGAEARAPLRAKGPEKVLGPQNRSVQRTILDTSRVPVNPVFMRASGGMARPGLEPGTPRFSGAPKLAPNVRICRSFVSAGVLRIRLVTGGLPGVLDHGWGWWSKTPRPNLPPWEATASLEGARRNGPGLCLQLARRGSSAARRTSHSRIQFRVLATA